MDEFIDLEVCLRPQRLAVLVPQDDKKSVLRKAMRFLSMLWGGDYNHLLPLGDAQTTNYAFDTLKNSRPDIVISIGASNKGLKEAIFNTCQPLDFIEFPADQQSLASDYRLRDLAYANIAYKKIETDYPRLDQSAASFWSIDPKWKFADIACAATGFLDRDDVPATARDFTASVSSISDSADFSEFTKLCSRLFDHWTWLDVAGYGLSGDHSFNTAGFKPPPTIIVINDPVADICYYWNIRAAGGHGAPSRILPVPVAEIKREASIRAISDWLIDTRNHSSKANYAEIHSLTADSKILQELARKLRPRARKHGILTIDAITTSKPCPIIIPSYSKTVITARKNNRHLSLPIPKDNSQYAPRSFVCDILSDASTRRPPFDYFAPNTPLAIELARAAAAPYISFPSHVTVGPTSIGLKCGRNDQVKYFEYPTDEEFFEPLLKSAGFCLHTDDKRTRYDLFINRFSGLWEAADCCSDIYGTTLCSLQRWQTRPELAARVKIGKNSLKPKRFSGTIKLLNGMQSEQLNLSKKRFERYYKKHLLHADTLDELLQKWVRADIIEDGWRAQRCEYCNLTVATVTRDLNSITCDRCGKEYSRIDNANRVYKLTDPIAAAIQQGAKPVIMTARYFKHLSKTGCMHLLGVSGQYKNIDADLDYIGCCDSKIVVAECKTRMASSWDTATIKSTLTQFRRTVNIAKSLNASIVALSSLSKEYPDALIRMAREQSAPGFGVALLTKRELEQPFNGYDEKARYRNIDDLIPQIQRRPKTPRSKRKRITQYGGMTITSGE